MDTGTSEQAGEILVIFTPALQDEFRAWLASRGLRLDRIPAGDDLPTFGIGLAGGFREGGR